MLLMPEAFRVLLHNIGLRTREPRTAIATQSIA
jgi:hypothetical protein